jgi:hypothetical protein
MRIFSSIGYISTADLLQVSQLLTAPDFQIHSGPVLQSLSLQQRSHCCFEFTAGPEAYPVMAHSLCFYWSADAACAPACR